MTINSVETSEQEQDEAEELHGAIVADTHDMRPEFGPTGKVGSAELFFKRLRDRLSSYGIDLDKLPKKTSLDSPPPCFEMTGTDYEGWLSMASYEHNTMPKIRLDMPGEPNYCADCLPAFRGRAIKAGTCLFPGVRFEIHRDRVTQEKEMFGVSRSANVTVEELDDAKEIQFGEVRIPEAAIRAELREALEWRRKGGGRIVGKRDWWSVPQRVRSGISIPTPPPTVDVVSTEGNDQ